MDSATAVQGMTKACLVQRKGTMQASHFCPPRTMAPNVHGAAVSI